MDKSYIAGFFDGEGSAMAITSRSVLRNGDVIYRIRPVISISQKTVGVLEEIKRTLGYGHLDKKHNGAQKYVVNSRGNIIRFVEDISPFAFIKLDQLLLLKEMSIFKGEIENKGRYSIEEMETMIDYRDRIHKLNSKTRTNISLKYTKDIILSEYSEDAVETYRKKRKLHAIELGKKYGAKNHFPRKMIECKCGCGQLLEDLDNKGRKREYIHGHNNKGKHWKQTKEVDNN